MYKIASVCWLYRINYGGVETRAKHIAAGLARLSNNVELIYAKTPFTRREGGSSFTEKGIFLAQNPYRSPFLSKHQWEDIFIRKTASYLKTAPGNWSFVDAQGAEAAAGILAGLPTVATIHGAGPWVENPGDRQKMILDKASLLIAISERSRDRLLEAGGVEPNRVFVVRNGVDLPAVENARPLSSDDLAAYRLDASRRIVLSVHNFAPMKNCDRVISAFERLSGSGADCQLVFIGDGPGRREVERSVRQRGIERVFFLGRLPQPEVYRFYRSATVFFLPSTKESWGNVFIEAAAAGCPVITSSKCGVTEVLTHMKHAWIVADPSSRDEVDEALTRMYGDEALRSIVASGARSVAASLDWSKQSEIFFDLVRKHVAM